MDKHEIIRQRFIQRPNSKVKRLYNEEDKAEKFLISNARNLLSIVIQEFIYNHYVFAKTFASKLTRKMNPENDDINMDRMFEKYSKEFPEYNFYKDRELLKDYLKWFRYYNFYLDDMDVMNLLYSLPWKMNKYLIDNIDDPYQALFYAQYVVNNCIGFEELKEAIKNKKHLDAKDIDYIFCGTIPIYNSNLFKECKEYARELADKHNLF